MLDFVVRFFDFFRDRIFLEGIIIYIGSLSQLQPLKE